MTEANSPLLRRYYELRQYLGIDLLALDKAFMETPGILQQAGELSAEADATENAAKHTLDIIKAETAERIRAIPVGGKDPSEARIASLLPLQQEVQDARAELDKANYEARVCQALYKSLDTQARLLSKASDMVLSGYTAPSGAYEQRRAELAKARREQGQERQQAKHDEPIN